MAEFGLTTGWDFDPPTNITAGVGFSASVPGLDHGELILFVLNSTAIAVTHTLTQQRADEFRIESVFIPPSTPILNVVELHWLLVIQAYYHQTHYSIYQDNQQFHLVRL